MCKNRGGDGGEDGYRSKRGADVHHLLGKVGNKVISSEEGRKGREGRGGNRTWKNLPGVGGRVDFGPIEGRLFLLT